MLLCDAGIMSCSIELSSQAVFMILAYVILIYVLRTKFEPSFIPMDVLYINYNIKYYKKYLYVSLYISHH